MTVAYATPAQLAIYLGTAAPADAARLLGRASELMDDTVAVAFSVDGGTHLPSDATVAAALADATCAQVEQWIEVGEANAIDGLAGTTFSVGGYSGKRGPRIAPRAVLALRSADLLRAGA